MAATTTVRCFVLSARRSISGATRNITSSSTLKTNQKSISVVTHTGQVWSETDFRNARFVDKEKQVNERFAIDLVAEEPPKACSQRIVSCDGGDGPLGHPKVYINLDQPGNHTCGYCGLRFFKEDHH